MIFKTNITEIGYIFVTFFMEVNGETVASGAAKSIIAQDSKVFGNRLVPVRFGGEFRIFLSEASFEDNVVFVANAVINEGTRTRPDISIVQSNATLEVIGKWMHKLLFTFKCSAQKYIQMGNGSENRR